MTPERRAELRTLCAREVWGEMAAALPEALDALDAAYEVARRVRANSPALPPEMAARHATRLAEGRESLDELIDIAHTKLPQGMRVFCESLYRRGISDGVSVGIDIGIEKARAFLHTAMESTDSPWPTPNYERTDPT